MDEIIKLAKQAGIKRRTDVFYSEYCDGIYGGELEAFAKLVEDAAFTRWAAQTKLAVVNERAACIKAVEQSRAHQLVWYPEGYSVNPNKIDSFYEFQWQRSVDAIKART